MCKEIAHQPVLHMQEQVCKFVDREEQTVVSLYNGMTIIYDQDN